MNLRKITLFLDKIIFKIDLDLETIGLVVLGVNGVHGIMYSLGLPIIIGIKNQLRMLWVIPIIVLLSLFWLKIISKIFKRHNYKRRIVEHE